MSDGGVNGGTYYDRTATRVYLDGTTMFQTEADRAAEKEVAAEIERRWNCKLHHFGAFAPIDWYATRFSRLVGLLELKNRSHASNTHATVWLNLRKWLALQLGTVGTGVPSLFVVKFMDGVRWIPIRKVDAGIIRIAGCKRIVKADNDIEPVIDVPVDSMRELGGEP